jgi:hypothetical protein
MVREIGIRIESSNQNCRLLKTADVSNLTSIAAQKAITTKKRSAKILISRFTERGALNKKSKKKLDTLIYVFKS